MTLVKAVIINRDDNDIWWVSESDDVELTQQESDAWNQELQDCKNGIIESITIQNGSNMYNLSTAFLATTAFCSIVACEEFIIPPNIGENPIAPDPPIEVPTDELFTLSNEAYGYYTDLGNFDNAGAKYIAYPHSNELDFSTGDSFTIEFDYIFHPIYNEGYNYLVSKADPNNDYRGWYFANRSDQDSFQFQLRSSGNNKLVLEWPFTIDPLRKYRFKIFCDGSTVDLYIDNALQSKAVTSDNLTGSINNTSDLVLLCSPTLSADGNKTKGEIKHLAIYGTSNTESNTVEHVTSIEDMPSYGDLVLFSDFENDFFSGDWSIEEEVHGNNGASNNMGENDRRPKDFPLTQLHVSTGQEIIDKRIEAIDFYFNGNGLPTDLPTLITDDFQNDSYVAPDRQTWDKLDHIEKLESPNQINGIETYLYHFVPTTPNGEFILYTFGHGDYWTDAEQYGYADFIKSALDRGYTVISSYMVLRGDNKTMSGYQDHNDFIGKDTDTYSSVGCFLYQHAVSINYAESLGFTTIYSCGLSGGAWTNNIYAAIDTRISKSCEVGGSMPAFIFDGDRQNETTGDYEQASKLASTSPQLYDFTRNVCGKLDNYVLSGYQRNHMQILIIGDDVGGNVLGFQAEFGGLWKDDIEGVFSVVYRFHVDNTTNTEHTHSQYAIDLFLDSL